MPETDAKKRAKKPAVYALSRASRCYNCDRKLLEGDIVQLKQAEDDREVLCQSCAGLGHLEALASGNIKITKLASKYASEQFVIMKWSELWKCYERKGVLLDPAAIDKAEEELGFKLKNRHTVQQK